MRFDALEPALAELTARAGELADATARDPAATRLRRYGPEEQVVARLELAGPERRLARVHAGVDIRGDGASEAYTGRVRRRLIEPAGGEDVIAALVHAVRDERRTNE
ncbi:MAG: hypothetical protein JO130_06495 [Solirubrobacterales bacterium]|nr:hypothetical protein [Solirubrobacterales bacterium]